MDSKHSSPRTSVTGMSNLIYDKYPGSRTTALPQSLYISTHDGTAQVAQQPSPRIISTSLLDKYMSEPAPPPHLKSHQITVQHLNSNANQQGGHVRIQRPGLPKPETQTVPVTSMHPIRVVNTAATQNTVYPNITKPATPNAILTTKLRGLHYETVPPKAKEGQSEAEKKLAALTEQLEKDMHINNQASKKGLDISVSVEQRTEPPPPPYPGSRPGPITIPVNSVPNLSSGPSYTNALVNSQFVTSGGSNLSTPSSSRSNLATSPYKTPLPVQITPPKPKGPTEAEKKIEALTHELESQMDKNPQGDYYGM